MACQNKGTLFNEFVDFMDNKAVARKYICYSIMR